MDKYSKAVLTDAKHEYTKELKKVLTEPIYKSLRELYNNAKKNSLINNISALKSFQLLLSETHKWGEEKIVSEVSRIITAKDRDYLEDLLTAVFVTHTKILVSIKFNDSAKTLDLDVPKITYFIHRVLIQCARNFWRQPWLLHTSYSSLDLQRNLIKSEKLIQDSVNETIRDLLPIRELLKQYLGGKFSEENYSNYEDDDITSTISVRTKNNIKKLLKYEMDNVLKVDRDTDFSKISVMKTPGKNPTTVKLEDDIDTETTDMMNKLNSINETGTQTEPIIKLDDETAKNPGVNHLNETLIPENSHALENPNKSIPLGLSPENFDNRTIDELLSQDRHKLLDGENGVNDIRTEVEDFSVFNDAESTKSNSSYQDFSFFRDAADF